MSAEYGFDAAVMMMRLGRNEEASKLLWAVIRQDHNHADAWDLRARLEAEAGRPENALLHVGFAIQAAPHRFELWHNKGLIEAACHMYPQAVASFEKANEFQETWESHFNRGNVFCNQMLIEQALPCYRRALELDTTENAQLFVNYGQCLMAIGDWREGFKHYRHRFNSPGFPPAPRHKYPLWRGEPVEGKTVLLFVEQGFGDEILSLRFAKTVKDAGARVILAVRPPMFRLARSFQHADAVMLMYDEPPWTPDYCAPLLDVPAFMDLSPESVPCRGAYLAPPDRGLMLEMPRGFNVGICWSSGKRDLQPHVADTAKAKSLSFEQIHSVFDGMTGVNLFSLQQTHSQDAALRGLGIRDPMAGVTDFADTAFIIKHLDLVVTVDTSVAHLAGALGKPVWNLVRYDALWPWMQETVKSCWYESMSIYRQTQPFDWSQPLARIRKDLASDRNWKMAS